MDVADASFPTVVQEPQKPTTPVDVDAGHEFADGGVADGSSDACVPTGCTASECGARADGCGGQVGCGSCAIGRVCDTEALTCQCAPSAECEPGDCGIRLDDGCGGPAMALCAACSDDLVSGMLGAYAVRATSYHRSSVVIRREEVLLAEVVRADVGGGVRMRGTLCAVTDAFELMGTTGTAEYNLGVDPPTWERDLRMNELDRTWVLPDTHVHLGYDPGRPSYCPDPLDTRTLERARAWLDEPCACPEIDTADAALPPTNTTTNTAGVRDCRVVDGDGTGEAGTTRRIRWGAVDVDQPVAMRRVFGWTGIVDDTGALAAAAAWDEDSRLVPLSCPPGAIQCPGAEVSCAPDGAGQVRCARLPANGGDWNCAAVVERADQLLPLAPPSEWPKHSACSP